MFGRVKKIIYKYTSFGKTRYLNFLYRYDMNKYIKHSGMNESNIEIMAAKMRILSHAIEKGMSLPNCRQGFGKDKIVEMVKLYEEYSKNATMGDTQVLALVRATILGYVNFQEQYNVDTSFIPKKFREPLNEQIHFGIEHIKGGTGTDFANIAKARHSLRDYSDIVIDKEVIIEAVSLAQTAPSACNRQATHVYACLSSKKIDEIIKMHGGIRGFGKPSVIFAITGDLNMYQNEYERNTVFVDGGIFLMNFLYALDSFGIASCPIIWGAEPGNDTKLSQLLSIPETHKIISLVTAGYYPKGDIKVTVSPKRNTSSVLKFVEK